MREHFISEVFCACTRFALELARFSHDGIGLLLGNAHDLLFARNGDSLATRIFDKT